jgi:hypothetical protein
MKQMEALALGLAILAVSATLAAETASAQGVVGDYGGARIGWGGVGAVDAWRGAGWGRRGPAASSYNGYGYGYGYGYPYTYGYGGYYPADYGYGTGGLLSHPEGCYLTRQWGPLGPQWVRVCY